MNKKDLALFGILTIKEKVAIADFLGVKTYPYEMVWENGKHIYLFKEDAVEIEEAEIALDMPFPADFILLNKRLDEVYQAPNDEDIFSFDRDALRFSEKFIKLVKSKSRMFENIEIGCIQEGEKYQIKQDYLGYEELFTEGDDNLQFLKQVNIFAVKVEIKDVYSKKER